MSVQSDIFNGLADVYEAGAKSVRGYVYNHDAQREAETLQAMAAKAREVAQQFTAETSPS